MAQFFIDLFFLLNFWINLRTFYNLNSWSFFLFSLAIFFCSFSKASILSLHWSKWCSGSQVSIKKSSVRSDMISVWCFSMWGGGFSIGIYTKFEFKEVWNLVMRLSTEATDVDWCGLSTSFLKPALFGCCKIKDYLLLALKLTNLPSKCIFLFMFTVVQLS